MGTLVPYLRVPRGGPSSAIPDQSIGTTTFGERERQRMGTKRWTRIAVVVATCMGSMGVSLVAGAPAGAATAALYAYAGGTKASGVCVSTTTPSGQCSLQHALALATPSGAAIRTIDLATAGSNVGTVGDPSHYTGNWAVLLAHTASATPLVIQAAPGLATAPILDGDGGGIATPCETPVGAPDCSGAILTITGPGYLTVSGITLANANNTATGNGGGIDNGDTGPGGTITVLSSTFTNLIAACDGGAIDNADNALGTGTVTITGSTFSSDSAGCDGGAIDSSDNGGSGGLSVTSSTFTSDSASADGGAIDSADNAGTGTLAVTGSTFTSDTAVGSGGAINNAGNSGTGNGATVATSSFSLNSSTGDNGGAIDNADYAGTGTMAVTGSSFISDTAAFDGGAIDSADNGGIAGISHLTVSGSTFTSNSAAYDGGAIDNADSSGTGTLGVASSTFTLNTASSDGGAIDNADTSGTGSGASVTTSSFISNTASTDGGAIDNADFGGTGLGMTVSGSTFSSNIASTNDGGAIDNADNGGTATLAVATSTFAGNAAAYNGGAIDNADSAGTATLAVATSTFAANSATVDGGAIDNADDASTTAPFGSGTLSVVASTLVGNTAAVSGGAGIATVTSSATGVGSVTVAGDQLADACGQNTGTWVDLGSNVGDPTCLNAGPGNVSDAALASVIGPLADNGGPTQTMQPLSGNPGIGLVANPTAVSVGGASRALCPTTDQRGTANTAGTACYAGSVQGPPDILAITSAPLSITASASATSPITVTVHDHYGTPVNVLKDTTVHLASTSANGTFATTSGGPSVTSIVISAGSSAATAYYGDRKAGTPTITASTSGVASGTQIEQIVPGAATRLSVVAPATVAAGTPTTVSVTAQDAFANTAVGYLGTVRLTSTDGAASLPGPYSYGAADHGVHAFSVTFGSGSTRTVTAADTVTPSITGTSGTITVPAPPPPPPPPVVVPSHGYWLVGADGGIFTFGAAQFHGSTGDFTLQRPVVGITPTSDRNGYWLVATDGGIFAFGDAGFHGSIPGIGLAPAGTVGAPSVLAAPIVAMVPSNDGGGYFMVAADGGVFAFGDAQFAGSCPSIGGCSGSAVAVMPDASGRGYWLVTALGNVYSFGDAASYGSPGTQGSVVTSAQRAADGQGYWILFANGTVTAFGSAVGRGGPTGAVGAFNPATAIFATADGSGYWVAAAGGGVFTYGSAPFDGDMSGAHLNSQIIAASGW